MKTHITEIYSTSCFVPMGMIVCALVAHTESRLGPKVLSVVTGHLTGFLDVVKAAIFRLGHFSEDGKNALCGLVGSEQPLAAVSSMSLPRAASDKPPTWHGFCSLSLSLSL